MKLYFCFWGQSILWILLIGVAVETIFLRNSLQNHELLLLSFSSPAAGLDGDDHNMFPSYINVNHSSLAAQTFPDCYQDFNQSTAFHRQLQENLSSEPWSDFDWWSLSQASCGCNKCFYPSRSNHSEGYLVAANIVKVYQNMRQSMQVEEMLRRKAFARVVSLGYPTLVDVPSRSLMCLLADRTYQPSRPADLQLNIFFPNRTYRVNSTHPSQDQKQLVVQKVLRVPEPYLLLGWSANKIEHVKKQLPVFIGKHVRDRRVFIETLSAELLEHIPRAFDVVPDLALDMQGLLDTQGNFYHIDLDRVYKRWSSSMKEWAHVRVRDGTQQILQVLRHLDEAEQ